MEEDEEVLVSLDSVEHGEEEESIDVLEPNENQDSVDETGENVNNEHGHFTVEEGDDVSDSNNEGFAEENVNQESITDILEGTTEEILQTVEESTEGPEEATEGFEEIEISRDETEDALEENHEEEVDEEEELGPPELEEDFGLEEVVNEPEEDDGQEPETVVDECDNASENVEEPEEHTEEPKMLEDEPDSVKPEDIIEHPEIFLDQDGGNEPTEGSEPENNVDNMLNVGDEMAEESCQLKDRYEELEVGEIDTEEVFYEKDQLSEQSEDHGGGSDIGYADHEDGMDHSRLLVIRKPAPVSVTIEPVDDMSDLVSPISPGLLEFFGSASSDENMQEEEIVEEDLSEDLFMDHVQDNDKYWIKSFIKYHSTDTLRDVCSRTDEDGYTPLTLAAGLGHLKLLRLLGRKGVWLFNVDGNGMAPIHMAAICGHVNVVKFLAGMGHYFLKGPGGQTAMHLAAREGHLPVIEVLQGFCHMNVPNSAGHSPLFLACQSGKHDVVKYLLDIGATPNVPDVIASGQSRVLEVLIEADVDVKFQDDKGETELMLAIRHDQLEMAQLLINHGSSVNAVNKRSHSALYIAAAGENPDLVELLLGCGADIHACAVGGWSALHFACHNMKSVEIIQLLMQAGCDPLGSAVEDAIPPPGIVMFTAALFENRAGIDKIYEKHQKFFQLLFGSAASIYRLAKICERKHLSYLKKTGVNLDKRNTSGWSALHYAAQEGCLSAAARLCGVGSSSNAADLHGNTPLHLACSQGHSQIVKVLLMHGAKINMCNSASEHCLFMAVKEGNVEVLETLRKSKKSFDLEVKNTLGKTCLHTSVEADNEDVLERLLQYGADVNSRSRSGETVIHLASRLGRGGLIPKLIEYGANVHSLTPAQQTGLHLAAKQGHLVVVLELCLAGANVNAEDTTCRRPIHLAARNGHLHVVETLLDGGSKVRLLEEDGSVCYDLAKNAEVWALLKDWALSQNSLSEIGGHRGRPCGFQRPRQPGMGHYLHSQNMHRNPSPTCRPPHHFSETIL